MKRILLFLMLVILLARWLGLPSFAGSDKERGDKGQSCVNKIQVQDPPSFQP